MTSKRHPPNSAEQRAPRTSADLNTATTAESNVKWLLSSGYVMRTPEELAQAEKQFNKVYKLCNEMIDLTRKLRNHATIAEKALCHTNTFPKDKEAFVELLKPLHKAYTNLYKSSRDLPKALLPTPGLEIMRSAYIHEEPERSIATRLHNLLIDQTNSTIEQRHFLHYYSSLLFPLHYAPKHYKFCHTDTLPRPVLFDSATKGHQCYATAVCGLVQEAKAKNLGIKMKGLFATSTSSVVEFKFFIPSTSANAYLIKFLLIERNGAVEYISMRAPEEDWNYTEGDPNKMLDPYKPSKWQSYQLLTRQANAHLQNDFGTADNWRIDKLLMFVCIFAKFRDVFMGKCQGCNKHLRNFLPPTFFKVKKQGFAFHKGCQ